MIRATLPFVFALVVVCVGKPVAEAKDVLTMLILALNSKEEAKVWGFVKDFCAPGQVTESQRV